MGRSRLDLVEIAHHRELAPVLARWHVDEWQHLYRDWDYDAAVAEFLAMDTPGRVPTTWIAFADAGRTPSDVLGSVSLIADDELDGFRELGPWLASLYVVPHHRGRGLGAALVRHTVDQARVMGIERLHLFTAGQVDFYRALGWRTVARAEARGEVADVMVHDTDRRAARCAVATAWCSDPDIAGVYSHLRPGGTPDDRDLLAAAVAPGLYLAGEATWRAHPGTMHGAWFSGERAASEIRTVLGPRARVTVVGAGLAGLAAARSLSATGHPTIVLEAADAPGGRIRSTRVLGGAVNLGAAWIHGEDDNPIAALADRVGVARTHGVFDDVATFVGGVGEVAAVAVTRLELMRAGIDAELARLTTTARLDDALGPALRDVLAKATDGRDATDAIVLGCWLRGEHENLYAASVDHLSLAHRAEPFRMEGDDTMLLGAAGDIADHIAADLDVRYETRARAVTQVGAGWRVDVGDESFESDAVIVTIPIGALQAGRMRFDPPLPHAVRSALAHLGPGRVAKVFLTFDDAFWAPHRAFWVADEPPQPLELWVDVSALTGTPTLCTFASGEHVSAMEQASEDELCRLGTDGLRRAQIALVNHV